MNFPQLLIEGLFAIVLTGIGFFLHQIASKLEKVADTIASLRVEIVNLKVEMVADFVKKEEWRELRIRLHDVEDRVAGLMATQFLDSERRKTPR